MTKKILTGVLASLLILGAFIPTGTFADETTILEGDTPTKEYKNPFNKPERTPEEKAELRLEIIGTYAPDQVDVYTALEEEHKAIHDSIDTLKAEAKTLRESYQEGLREEVKSLC